MSEDDDRAKDGEELARRREDGAQQGPKRGHSHEDEVLEVGAIQLSKVLKVIIIILINYTLFLH